MTTRGAAIQGTLAAVGLLAAYATWQREPERPPGESVVFDFNKSDLSKVRFEDGGKWVELESRPDPDGDGPAAWLRVSASTVEPKTPERELRGSEAALKLFEKFAPLRATRALGVLPADKLKELGLDAPKKRLELTARGGKQVLLVGSSPYGASEPYVKDERDGKVFVLGGGVISDLDAAAIRLVDRALHSFKQPDFDGLTVAAGGKKRALVQLNAATPMTAKIAPKATPDKPDDTAKNWHDKIWRLMVIEALGKGEAPPDPPKVAVRIDYTASGKPKGWLEIAHPAPSPSVPQPVLKPGEKPTPLPPPPSCYARTEHTAGWVKLPATSDDLVKEGEQIAAKE